MSLKKLCAYPGCFRPTDIGEKYCSLHRAKGKAHDEQVRQKRLNAFRKPSRSSTQLGYGYRWQMLRNRFIAQHPYCEECMKRGVLTMATDVDHVKPHHGDPRLLYDEENLQSLCKSCHSRKTVKEDGGLGNRKKQL